MVYSQYIHIRCGSSSVKAYNTNYLIYVVSMSSQEDRAAAFKNNLKSLQYSLKSLQFLIFAGNS